MPLCLCKQLQKRWIKTEINQIKRGTVIELNSKLFAVLASNQRSQGRGGSHYKLELKDLKTGGKAFERVNAGQFVEVVELQQKEFQFMYADESLHVIDQETFEEMSLDGELINGIWM
jgi:elongation factor P